MATKETVEVPDVAPVELGQSQDIANAWESYLPVDNPEPGCRARVMEPGSCTKRVQLHTNSVGLLESYAKLSCQPKRHSQILLWGE